MKKYHHVTERPSTLEVRHMRLMRAIASEGSVTRAAVRLHCTQSALSHQLLHLEDELAVRLFDRVGKRMVPTVAGSRLLAACDRMLSDIEMLERDLRAADASLVVPLRITASCYTGYHWLPKAIARFHATHPRIEIRIVLEGTRRALESLIADEVDLAILTEPPRDESWAVSNIVTSEFVALISPEHRCVAGRRVRDALKWADLFGETILVHDMTDKLTQRLEHAVRDGHERRTGERVSHPVVVRRIPLTEAMVELARLGSGIALADRWMVEPYSDKSLLCLPLVPRGHRTFYAAWRKSNPRDLPMQELMKMISVASSVVDRPRRRRASSTT